jgi:hypothetical protein
MALAGERSEPVRLRSVTTMHALFKRQVERKMTPVTGLFSSPTPGFESYQPGILNRPAVMPCGLPRAQRQPKSLPQLHVRHAAAQTRRIPQFESDHPSHAVGLADGEGRDCLAPAAGGQAGAGESSRK